LGAADEAVLNIVHEKNPKKSPFKLFLQIANPQILGLIPLLQIYKFRSHATPRIPNPQIFIVNAKIPAKR
jgi:hypothetical protein